VTAYVIDASVILKWFIPEDYSEPALRLKHAGAQFHAPAFLSLEVGSVLSKKRRRGELAAQDTPRIFGKHFDAPLSADTPTRPSSLPPLISLT